MTRFSNGTARLRPAGNRSWMSDVDTRMPAKTLHDVRDDLRLKRALRRAVEGDVTPQSLIDAIKKGIRG